MLPKGWKQVPLHTVAEVRTGLSKNARREGATLKRPYLRVANVQDGALDLSDVQEIDVPASQMPRYTLQSGDLLLIEGNGNPENLGRGCLWRGQIPEAVHQNHVFAVRTHTNGPLLPEFLELQVQSPYGRGYFLSCAKGSTGLSSLNSTQLKSFPVILPSYEEQCRIARVIYTWDAAITTTEKLLTNSRKQKQALIQHLLFQSEAQVDKYCLSDISERVKRDSDGDEHPILMISSGSGFVQQNQKYSRFMAGKSLNDYILLKRGEFAYNKGNSKLYEFGCVFPLENYDTGLVPHVYVCFQLDERCHPDYFKFLFEADYLHDQLGALVNTGVRNNGLLNIRPADFMNVTVPVPPLARQEYIADVLMAASEQARLLQEDLDALRLQKRVLLADLLTGKRRVRVANSMAEPEAA
ncbi:restriction endonuclease subunit S [Burkholderia sola]|uniref:restriction endonuclease subunit S n=1 Tax=Burkholderia sola TaxID=2843302 RepID=UPI001C0A88EB|nr:Type-1 restriction enzyme EcoKI specificity protein [Burkholderia cenocepacia]CAG2258222.1 Type-1 restriction enzyme EcoKI specificity protein [Burkholderia cenocepacia]CAG2258245.1 Type-1 restriction enzyme EcoKI specificity protein [Burkholderia cenocepacia]CAG2258311.1 Type-1 restriction enzyme EcoKI specificity protein [Burkholderia cenocepacia]CAG2258319.1 Type-1 restriction enzyme EcoKI specificity protein [Burkholderia cenocepacia]